MIKVRKIDRKILDSLYSQPPVHIPALAKRIRHQENTVREAIQALIAIEFIERLPTGECMLSPIGLQFTEEIQC